MSDSPLSSAPSAATETPKAGPSNFRLRVIWGLIGAALLLGSVWFSPWTFGLFFAFVQAVMLWEFYRMMEKGGSKPAVWLGLLASLILFATVHFYAGFRSYAAVPASGYNVYAPGVGFTEEGKDFEPDMAFSTTLPKLITGCVSGLLLLMVLVVLLEVKKWPDNGKPFNNIAATYGGLLYVSLPMSLLSLIAFGGNAYDYRRVIVLLFLVWSADIGAYFSGKALGKHKLAPAISPGKTWEGWAGGAILTLVMGWALGFLIPELPLAHRLVAAGVVAVFGPLGDLAESMLKRSVDMKDSGSIMPGHGGLLDRFDAFLLVLPILALLQLLAG